MSEKEFETLLEDYLPEEKKSGDNGKLVGGKISKKWEQIIAYRCRNQHF